MYWNIFEGKGVYFISSFNRNQTVVLKSFSEIHLSPAHVNLHVSHCIMWFNFIVTSNFIFVSFIPSMIQFHVKKQGKHNMDKQ